MKSKSGIEKVVKAWFVFNILSIIATLVMLFYGFAKGVNLFIDEYSVLPPQLWFITPVAGLVLAGIIVYSYKRDRELFANSVITQTVVYSLSNLGFTIGNYSKIGMYALTGLIPIAFLAYIGYKLYSNKKELMKVFW